MIEPADSGDALRLAEQLHSTAIHLLRRLRRQDAAAGEAPARLSALSVLVFGGPKMLGELAAAEQVKPPTMSRIVAGLVRSGLVDVAQDPHDARRRRIRASTKGVQLFQKARERRVEDLTKQLKRLSTEQLSRIGEATEILQTLLKNWNISTDGN